MGQMRALLLGGCNIHAPIQALLDAGRAELVHAELSRDGDSLGVVYSFGEMCQYITFLRGEIALPKEIRLLSGVPLDFETSPEVRSSRAIDVVLGAPSSAVELQFRGYNINIGYMNEYVYDPLREISPEMHKLVYTWYENGVIPQNEEVQREIAEKLIVAFPDDYPYPELGAAVLREARAEPTDVTKALPWLYDLLNEPLGLLSWALRYMPDGRPIFWPKAFSESVLSVSRKLGVPIMEPWRLVNQYGVATAMQSDMRHYKEEFNPIVGKAIVDFARRVKNDGRASSPRARTGLRGLKPPTPAPRELAADDNRAAQGETALTLAPVSARTATARINSFLQELHHRRVDELGIDESGLYSHYNYLLEGNRLAGPQVETLAHLIGRQLPKFDRYDVLRAGLGELAFVLAAMGMQASAYEPLEKRYSAVEAGLAALGAIDPEISQRLVIGDAVIPQVPDDNDILAVAVYLLGYKAEQEEQALVSLCRYRAILMDPKLFLWSRNSFDEQEAAVAAVRAKGFRVSREFQGTGLVFLEKAGLEPEDIGR